MPGVTLPYLKHPSFEATPNQKNVRNPKHHYFTFRSAESMVMKFHGNVRGEVRVNFRALFASEPHIFMCGTLKLSGIVRANVCLNIAIPMLFWSLIFLRKVSQYTSNLYCSTPPICIAVLLVPLRSEEREILSVLLPFVSQYASHLYCNAPPICIAVLLGKSWWLRSPGCSPLKTQSMRKDKDRFFPHLFLRISFLALCGNKVL